jgi:hypothetical protein
MRTSLITALLGVALAATPAIALGAGHKKSPAVNCGDTPCECGSPTCGGKCGGECIDRLKRSGYGLCVAPWARLTYGPDYKSYYVGGSVRPGTLDRRLRPEPRYPWEGTWGTDYVPLLTGSVLWWTHGRLYQDDGGQYEPDRRNFPFFLKFGR